MYAAFGTVALGAAMLLAFPGVRARLKASEMFDPRQLDSNN
jgi:hypothetical protein